jgi:hypothetical protein
MFVPRASTSLTGTWINNLCLNHKLFPVYFTIFISGRVSSSIFRGGGVLIAVSSRIRDYKRKYDLQLYEGMRLG